MNPTAISPDDDRRDQRGVALRQKSTRDRALPHLAQWLHTLREKITVDRMRLPMLLETPSKVDASPTLRRRGDADGLLAATALATT